MHTDAAPSNTIDDGMKPCTLELSHLRSSGGCSNTPFGPFESPGPEAFWDLRT